MTQFSELSALAHAQFKGVGYNEVDEKCVGSFGFLQKFVFILYMTQIRATTALAQGCPEGL